MTIWNLWFATLHESSSKGRIKKKSKRVHQVLTVFQFFQNNHHGALFSSKKKTFYHWPATFNKMPQTSCSR
jgi:polysaccharide deacetylase 2 family uncharacterized protein YibQ